MDETISKILNESPYDTIHKEIEQLKADVEKSYYRIPKQEFESVSVQKITKDVTENINKKINAIRNWVAALVLLFSFFGYKQWSNFSDQLKNESAAELKSSLVNIETNIKQAVTAETKEQFRQIEEGIKLVNIMSLNSELINLNTEVESGKIKNETALVRIDLLKNKIFDLNDTKLIGEYLDTLFRLTFGARKYEEMDKLRIEYEKKYEFSPVTWQNIMIADALMYEESSSPIYQERSIQAYNKALEKLPNYGEPYATYLSILMIEYMRKDEARKKQIINQAKELFTIINSGSSLITSFEVFSNIERNKEYTFGKYNEQLFILFPKEMKVMEERYLKYSGKVAG